MPISPSIHHKESGNVLFMILIAIVLTGLLTVALQNTSQTGNENIDRETMMIRASQIRQHLSEIENAIQYIFQNNLISESDLRFAHPEAPTDYGTITDTPEQQIFNRQGGAATYRLPPSGVNDGSNWEFYGGTAMPGVGSDRADLVAVLPNVTQEFCEFLNEQLGYTAQPQDPGTCVNEGAGGRFDAGTQFSASPNVPDDATFSITPALKACIECTADGSYHYVQVIMSR
ncbi:MAG: hypothetical protein H6855_04710 [Rhodospirillales bacterium]|nr:hypothetical protein [Rhodospirillales bacterium]